MDLGHTPRPAVMSDSQLFLYDPAQSTRMRWVIAVLVGLIIIFATLVGMTLHPTTYEWLRHAHSWVMSVVESGSVWAVAGSYATENAQNGNAPTKPTPAVSDLASADKEASNGDAPTKPTPAASDLASADKKATIAVKRAGQGKRNRTRKSKRRKRRARARR